MSTEMSLEGTRFLKYDEQYGIEECHVLKHDEEGGRYLVAFIPITSKTDSRKQFSVGDVNGNISWVYDWITKSYASQSQEKIAKIQKMDRKRRALITEILAPTQKDQKEQAASVGLPGSTFEFDREFPF